ncbi:ladderlectin-like isoform X5 [Xiphophorus maculatus]|uniref:ladderlectin-like isoform X5 n=1 Tax=Xiphophorus maculatus TaxID=8083 RepID=UPI000C6E57E5|nr:ladderlectin-like isoform X5 [Xiphophorus maculatus]
MISVNSCDLQIWIRNTVGFYVVMDFITGHGAKQAWIGGTNAQEESIWLWSDGSRFDYTHWCSGQNNKDGGNQRCLQINYSGAKCWDDLGSNHNLPSVCAKKP